MSAEQKGEISYIFNVTSGLVAGILLHDFGHLRPPPGTAVCSGLDLGASFRGRAKVGDWREDGIPDLPARIARLPVFSPTP